MATGKGTNGTVPNGVPSSASYESNYQLKEIFSSPSSSTAAVATSTTIKRNGNPNETSDEASNSHDSNVCSFLYHTGFLKGNWSDVRIHLSTECYGMHKLILSQSPYISSLLSSSHDIYLPIKDFLTRESYLIALGYLYSPSSLSGISTSNARSVLATSLFLQLPELSLISRDFCLRAIDGSTDPGDLIAWLEFTKQKSRDFNLQTTTADSIDNILILLNAHLLNHLISVLPNRFGAFSKPSSQASSESQASNKQNLALCYTHLPFEVFKEIIESKQFPATTNMERFNFAKKCIDLRKKYGTNQDSDENVVLAFGNDDSTSSSSNVSVVRKAKRGRHLYKVQG